MSQAELFGWLASIFTTIILVPQLIKALKTNLTHDISMWMLWLSVVGNGFWFLHALLMNNTPLLTSASLIILISFTLIVFKYLNEKQ